MNRDAAVDLLMLRLGNRNDTALRDKIIAEMIFVQETILEATYPYPWFMITRDDTLVTVADDETVTLPADFVAEWEDGGLARVNDESKEVKLVRQDYDIIRDQKDGTGAPEYYDIIGETIYLRKVPNEVYSLVQWYFGKQATLGSSYGTADTENTWLKFASDWMIAATGAIIAAQYLQSDKMAQSFLQQAQTAQGKLEARSVAMEESSKNRFMEG